MNTYLQQRTLHPPQIRRRPAPNLGMVVVIPAYDEPFLLRSLMSLHKCEPPRCSVEIIVVVNDSERDSKEVIERNLEIANQVDEWSRKNSRPERYYHVLYHSKLFHKHSGVGLARKIGMDEAVFRLEKAKNKRGVIVCFDADSKCDRNYLSEIDRHFREQTKTQACGIHFEHPLHGIDQEDDVYEAILDYELHLRYYVNAQRFAGFPFAYQTIGSSMAVRCDAYQQQGGMNRRKAGEDFYFLHKFIPLGKFTELNTTRVIPSPRCSHRVPFGTGKAVAELIKSKGEYLTYAPQSFIDLKIFFSIVSKLRTVDVPETEIIIGSLPQSIQAFLTEVNFSENLLEIQKNTKNAKTFKTRFFRWFNAFMLMKYVHFARDHYYPNVSIAETSAWLLIESKVDNTQPLSKLDMLKSWRKIDRAATFPK
ncbi:MAG: glycosyltransferase family 2 protein [Saprospiraceae bacterium]